MAILDSEKASTAIFRDIDRPFVTGTRLIFEMLEEKSFRLGILFINELRNDKGSSIRWILLLSHYIADGKGTVLIEYICMFKYIFGIDEIDFKINFVQINVLIQHLIRTSFFLISSYNVHTPYLFVYLFIYDIQ